MSENVFLGVLTINPGLREKRQATHDKEFTETAVEESSVHSDEANSNGNSVDSVLGEVHDPNDEDQSDSKISSECLHKFWFV